VSAADVTDLTAGPSLRGRRLVLLRHGRTAWNAVGRAQGQGDVGLDELGHEQAAAVAPYIASLQPASLWCSDLARARETCRYVEQEGGMTARLDPRLREYDVGRRQGLTTAEFAEQFPEEYDVWRGSDRVVPVLDGESEEQLLARMVPALRECLASVPMGRTAVAVTHGAAIKSALVALLGWPREQYASLRGMDNCAWATLEEAPTVRGGALDEDGADAPPRLLLLGYNESVRPGHEAPLAGPDDV
jgi:probable phosphoglycerate mutase